ncbi:MAG: mechanosensitive ion channel [Cyanobacteriota bacterium]|nr:mechanosensitive ion channel [Cyanobacteriota bacterium]
MSNSRLRFKFGLCAIAIALTLFFSAIPTAAVEENATAPILLDGRTLFQVSDSGRFAAEKRAEKANEVLEQQITASEVPVEVEVDTTQDIPVIEVNDAHVLSVTSEDVPDGSSAIVQAQEWATQIEIAIEQARYERTREYLGQAVLLAIACAALAGLSSSAMGWLWRRWRQLLLSRSLSESGEKNEVELLARFVLTSLRFALLVSVLVYITYLFPQTRQLSHNIASTLLVTLTSELFPLGGKSFSVLDLLRLLGLFALLIFAARSFKQLLRSRVLRLTGLSRAAQETIATISSYIFIFIGTIVVIQLWGLELSSLTVFAGVLGVGIGLGLQGIAKEFISGLTIILERPIQVGDFVEVGELMGTVEHISARSTTILTLDRIAVIVPNSRFLESEVINWSHRSPVSRLKLPVGVAYGSHLEKVKNTLLEAAREHPEVLSQPSPLVFFKRFGDSSLDFELLVWIADPPKQFRIKSDLYFLIDGLFRDRDIEIPFPQRDLHIRSGNKVGEISPQLSESLSQLSQSLAQWLNQQASNNGNGMKDRAIAQDETEKRT